ncbi:hypothetical protein LTR87_013923 [Friedmanniomyces endolithicus]|nr:hypothetical protein LTR87_013923 [Friedmanniomyces endolithicus]
MSKPLRRPSVPKLKCFPWVGNKASSYVGMVQEIKSMESESIMVQRDRLDPVADHLQLPQSNPSYDLAVFLRTTEPRGRESVRASHSTAVRSKSIPRRLLGHLREYYKPTRGMDLPPGPAPYKYDERLRAWVPQSPSEQVERLPDSVVQKTTLDGKKYFELKVTPPPGMDGVFSRGGSDAFYHDSRGSGNERCIDQMVLRDMTSDELLDGWLAGLDHNADSDSNSAQRMLVPPSTSSAVGHQLSLLLPASAEDDGAATEASGLRRASSTTGGRLSLWVPPTWSRDSVNTVILGTRRRSDAVELDAQGRHRTSLWELEDGDSHVVLSVASTFKPTNTEPETEGSITAWSTPSQCTRRPSTALSGDIAPSSDQSTEHNASRTFFARGDFEREVPGETQTYEKRDPERASNRRLVRESPCQSSSLDKVAYCVPAPISHEPLALDSKPNDHLLAGKWQGPVPAYSTGILPGKHPVTMRYVTPKYSAEVKDFFMEELQADKAGLCTDLPPVTRSALTCATAPDCASCGPGQKNAARVSREADSANDREADSANDNSGNVGGTSATTGRRIHADAAPATSSVQSYRPSGPFCSQIKLPRADRSMLSEKVPRHVHSEELLGRSGPNAWNQTKPLPEQPRKPSTKPAHISTLSRSTSSLQTHRQRSPKYTQAPTPPPEKDLPALPALLNHPDSVYPGPRVDRARAGVPPRPEHDEPMSNGRSSKDPSYSTADVKSLPTRRPKPYIHADLRSIGAQSMLRPNGDSASRLADMALLEAQLCEIQAQVVQLSAMVVDVLTRQY